MKSDISFDHLENLPLRERVAAKIRNAILKGEIAPGQTLIEAELAAQLGVSRAPIREALQILNAERFVESFPYHGTQVRELSQSDVEELYTLRSVLEQFAVQQVVAENKSENTLYLRQLYSEMMAAAEADDLDQVSEIDRGFHDALIELTRHQMLLDTWNIVSLRVRQVMALRRVRRRSLESNDIKQIAYSHLPIVEAIAEGNVDKAIDLIRQHIATSGDVVAADWQNGEVLHGSQG